MKRTRIPIDKMHEEARQLLQASHRIEYVDSMLGTHTQAKCACGWSSPSSTSNWIAQGAATRHYIAFVEHPLENRARYAIFWKVCGACNGSGRFETRDGVDQGKCAHCFGGGLWTTLDRDGQHPDHYAKTHAEAVRVLEGRLGMGR